MTCREAAPHRRRKNQVISQMMEKRLKAKIGGEKWQRREGRKEQRKQQKDCRSFRRKWELGTSKASEISHLEFLMCCSLHFRFKQWTMFWKKESRQGKVKVFRYENMFDWK